MRRIAAILTILIAFGGFFSYGFLVGAFQLPPHDQIVALKRALVPSGSTVDSFYEKQIKHKRDDRQLYDEPDGIFLELNFTHPIIKNVPQLYPPIRNIADISAQLTKMGLRDVPHDAFFGAVDRLKIGKIGPGHHPTTVTLPLEIDGHDLTSHAYKLPTTSSEKDCAILYMPGTGHNASTDILTGDPTFYKDSAAVAASYCDVYIYVRPLEDYRALHNGEYKAPENYMYGDAILNGSNHGTVYMIEALALAEALKRDYPRLGIIGLSLGGLTGFHLSLEVEPDFAVIASGWAVTNLTFSTAVISQLLIPGWHKVYTLDRIAERLRATRTRYLFTYSINEKSNYEYEARSGKTCAFLAKIDPDRLQCRLHGGGHQFDRPLTEEFYRRTLAELRRQS